MTLSEAQKQSLAGKRVLLVDDDPPIRQVIRQLLGPYGCLITEARDGLEGLDKYRAGGFDCVITDNKMPRGSGIELAAKIRAVAPAQYIVMFTASAHWLPREKPPWDSLLVKPFGVDELMAAVLASNKRDKEQ